MKYIKMALMVLLVLGSFYFSDKLLLYVENLSPLMKEVKKYAEDDILPVNAVIEDNTIIPGKNGKEVNIRESYLKMNEFGEFIKTFYVYDYIKPEISLYDNLDKVIIRGNSDDSLSIIVDNKRLEDYLLENNIKFNKLIDNKDDIKNNNVEYINGGKDYKAFEELNLYFKREDIVNKLCIVGYSSSKYCYEKKYLKVVPTMDVYASNLVSSLDLVGPGEILFIHDNLSLSEGKILINKIRSKKLNIIYLSDLVSE